VLTRISPRKSIEQLPTVGKVGTTNQEAAMQSESTINPQHSATQQTMLRRLSETENARSGKLPNSLAQQLRAILSSPKSSQDIDELKRQSSERSKQDRLSAKRYLQGARLRVFREQAMGHHHCRFAGYQPKTQRAKFAMNSAVAWANSFGEMLAKQQGLIFVGQVGTGKDHLLGAACNQVISTHAASVAWVYGPKFYRQLWDAIDLKQPSSTVYSRYDSADVLVISDVVPSRDPLSKGQQDALFNLLTERIDRKLITCASINAQSEVDADRMVGTKLWDRLKHGNRVVWFDWESYRRPVE
jgi:DNA replication protein DnaC